MSKEENKGGDYTKVPEGDIKTLELAVNKDGVPKLRFYQILFPQMNMGRSFMYDVPMILSSPLKSTMDISDQQIQWLYSAFYLPAIFFNLAYGGWMKKFGAGFTYVALLLMIVGHVLFMVGVFTGHYWLLLVGRVFIGGGGEGSLVSQTYVIKLYTHDGNVITLISACKAMARVALLICYYGLPQLYLATGGFTLPLSLGLVILGISTLSFAFYLPAAKKEAQLTNHGKAPVKKPFKMADLKLLPCKYYYLLAVRFGCLGAWFGFSAIFMQYLQSGCKMDYKVASLVLICMPFLSLTIVIMNMILTRYIKSKNYLNYSLLVISGIVSTFLWVSGFVVEKGWGMAVFGQIAIALSGGFYNVCIDTFNTKALPKEVASIGSAISMSVKGVSCIIFPIVNGALMGENATGEAISKVCMFLAIPSTIGFFFVILFLWDIHRENLRIQMTHKALGTFLQGMIEKAHTEDSETQEGDQSECPVEATKKQVDDVIDNALTNTIQQSQLCPDVLKEIKEDIKENIQELQKPKAKLNKQKTMELVQEFVRKNSVVKTLHEDRKEAVLKKDAGHTED